MKKSTKRILFTLGAAAATIYTYNKFVETTATKKNLLTDTNGEYFSWKDYQIYYTKTGTGSPLLLIHDADASSSSEEWTKVIHHLSHNHTIYCIDLLGCGRSDKPAIEYTNYFYVQMITSFIKEIIQEKTTVVSTNLSSSFIIMANHLDQDLFKKIILINPVSLKQLEVIPDEESKIKKRIIELPFVGTFIYNLMTSNKKIDEDFRTRYYEHAQLISSQTEDTYYEAAHTNGSQGRFLYSSMIGNYLNNNITHALKNLSTPTLIVGKKNNYDKINPNIETIELTNGNLYPQLEIPEEIASIIENYTE